MRGLSCLEGWAFRRSKRLRCRVDRLAHGCSFFLATSKQTWTCSCSLICGPGWSCAALSSFLKGLLQIHAGGRLWVWSSLTRTRLIQLTGQKALLRNNRIFIFLTEKRSRLTRRRCSYRSYLDIHGSSRA